MISYIRFKIIWTECRPYRYGIGSFQYEMEVLYTLEGEAGELTYFVDRDDNDISVEEIINILNDPSYEIVAYDLLTINYI